MKTQRIKNITKILLLKNWSKLYQYKYDFQLNNGDWVTHEREVYDRGNGAVILLYHKTKQTVILTKQFRVPTYANGNESGFMIEACAGILDKNNPVEEIKRETEEETGYRLANVQKVYEMYMSPGSVTEKLYFFIAEYDSSMKISDGGGLAQESEDIQVLEMPFSEALSMMKNGEIKDAKTIILLQYAQINQLFNE